MLAHLACLRVFLKHKWFVFIWCMRIGGIGIWRALIHDLSKLTPREWFGYVHTHFNKDGSKRDVRDASGAYDPNAQSIEFRIAWCSHQKNLHHWQAWISIGDHGEISPVPIPETYIREMIADWCGAGQANGNLDILGFYKKNGNKMIFHPSTRQRVEILLIRFAEEIGELNGNS